MKPYLLCILLYFGVVVSTITAQLPPMIHRIAPVDTAVDMMEPVAAISVPSFDADHGFAFAPNTTGLKFPGSPLFNEQPLSKGKGKQIMDGYRKEWGTPTNVKGQRGVRRKDVEKANRYENR